MYIVGCRDVRASWNILSESMDLEAGLDCLTGAIVSYPPITALWLANPAARISISGHRNEDDPSILARLSSELFLFMYRRHFYLAVGYSTSSMNWILSRSSLWLCYSPPLTTGAEALLQRKPSESYESSSYYLEKNQWLNGIDYVVKIPVMALSEGVEISYQITYKKPL
ncbi:pleiotropic drug resistance protein [Salix suchowensis]|nr:pleiotropic drug resistance protein [Salix suchowensis]